MKANRITHLFERSKRVFSIYLTAGFPSVDDTVPLCGELERSGVQMIELGIPFSDPVADGPVIQMSSQRALENGMTLPRVLAQVREMRSGNVTIPLLLMGYWNPVLQYGVERFCADCEAAGVDGVVLPDLPLDEYRARYRELFEAHGLSFVFLVTSETSERRIREIDSLSSGFIYLVSSHAVTGGALNVDKERTAYLERVSKMGLKAPLVVGFGIDSRRRFEEVTRFARGAIVGSAFIRAIDGASDVREAARAFVGSIINGDRS